jgi:KDO2-lipid IV(A) lauroyltransferase
MRWAGWTWNLMNLMSVPLLLGTGIDYSIHVQSALRRNRGDIRMTRRVTGRAILLCGCTTIAGFGSLAWSGNSGLASLGYVCATGIACAMLISLYVLPGVWRSVAGRAFAEPQATAASGKGPSVFYRRGFWRIGLLAARYLPAASCARLMRSLACLYSRLVPGRRRIVTENVLPGAAGDERQARAISGNLFGQFGVKLVDLWRFETGQSPDSLLIHESGWEHFMAARASGRGILIVTPHLGNWEFGGPLLIRRGVPLHVVTQVEPGQGFTELRKDARAKWGIETHIIGDKPFAVIEVIKLLERGAVVALLIDRPPPSTAVTVELFGRPFHASVAAAELARASGCAVLPVALPRLQNGYAAHIFPEVPYERSALNKRETRIQFTQTIVRTFEPVIQKHLDQWYHFVPVWPR